MIVSWQGSIATIPDGWALCDGNEGRPNLRNKFVIGASPTKAPLSTGGSGSHIHSFTGDGHRHDYRGGTDDNIGFGYREVSQFSNATGTFPPEAHEPPYYSLAFIVKVED